MFNEHLGKWQKNKYMLYYSIATKLLVKPILIYKNMNCIFYEKSVYIVQPIVNIVF